MATSVKGDWYEKLDGKLIEIKRQMRQFGGYPFDPAQLDCALQAIIEGRFEAVDNVEKITFSFADFIPKGWTVEKDVASNVFDMKKIKPVSFLKPGEEDGIDCEEELRKRAIELKGNFGLADGLRMLAEQDKIPVEFRKFTVLLPGTVLLDRHGCAEMPQLFYCVDRGWTLEFSWYEWGSFDDCFACCE